MRDMNSVAKMLVLSGPFPISLPGIHKFNMTRVKLSEYEPWACKYIFQEWRPHISGIVWFNLIECDY